MHKQHATDVIFKNIKHAIFQPCSKDTLQVPCRAALLVRSGRQVNERR